MINKLTMKWLISTGTIFFYFLLVKGHYQNQECRVDNTLSFPVQTGEQFSFKSQIKKNGGLIIDINYDDRKKDRIILESNKSLGSMHDGEKYVEIDLNPLLTEGQNNIEVFVENKTLRIVTNSLEIPPLVISIHPRINLITVLSENLNVCEESCNIEKSIEKIIGNGEKFQILAFTTSDYPITFDISDSQEDGTIGNFVMKPSICILMQKQTNRTTACDYIDQGWNRFDVFVNRTKLVINNHTIPVDFPLKSINISGSQLVNCKKGTPLWKISNGKEIPIPIASGQEIVLILTSNVSFSPAFDFDGNKLLLNWNNGLRCGSSGKPLKPKSYHLIFEITSERLRIYNENKIDTLVDLKIEKIPEYILASSLKGRYWITLSLEIPLKQSQKNYPTTLPSVATSTKQKDNIFAVNTQVTRSFEVTVTTQENSNSNLPYVITIVILSVLVATLAGTLMLLWKKPEILKTHQNQSIEVKRNTINEFCVESELDLLTTNTEHSNIEDKMGSKSNNIHSDNTDHDKLNHSKIKVDVTMSEENQQPAKQTTSQPTSGLTPNQIQMAWNLPTLVAPDELNTSIPMESDGLNKKEIKGQDGSQKTTSLLKIYDKTLYIKGHTGEMYQKDMKEFESAIKQDISNLRKIQVSNEDCCRVTFTSTISYLRDNNLDVLRNLNKLDFLKTFPISGIPIFSPFRGSTMLNPWIYGIHRILESPYTIMSQVVIDQMAAANPESVNEQSKGVKLQEQDDKTLFNAVIPVFPPNVASQMNHIMNTNIYAMCCTFSLLKNLNIIDFNIHMAALGIAWVRMLYENPVHPRPEYVQYRIECIEATAAQYSDRRRFAKYRELLIKNPIQALMTESTIEIDGKTIKCESLVKPMFFLHMAVQSKQITDNKIIKTIVETILVEYIGRCLSKGKRKSHSDFFTESLTDHNNNNLKEYAKEIKTKLTGHKENLLEVFYYEEQCKKAANRSVKEVIKSSYFELCNEIPMKVDMNNVNQLRNVSACGDVSWKTLRTFAKEVGLPRSDVEDLFNDENVFIYVSHAFKYTKSRERLQIRLPDHNVCAAEISKACALERSKKDIEKLTQMMVDCWLTSYEEAHSFEVQPMTKSQIIQEATGMEIDANDKNFDQVYKNYRPDVGLMGNACQSRSCPWFLKPMKTYNEHSRRQHVNTSHSSNIVSKVP